jgi:MOSC domain-containing protein YiiM
MMGTIWLHFLSGSRYMTQTLQVKPDGQIVQINISDGGVPKTPIPRGIVTKNGITGDRQNNLKYHGGPDRAVCLWSEEIITHLQAEGHPIKAGNAGENITISGLDWAQITPGTQLKLGTAVILEITDYAPPCRQNAHWFAERRFKRIDQAHYPGTSRLYARVITEGSIYPEDPVKIL